MIKSRGGWKRITAAGLITFNSRTKRVATLAWLSKWGMRKERLLLILRDLKCQHCRRQLVLLWDGLPAHQAKIVRQFVAENQGWLSVHRFPAYAPELNPQEYLWSAVKRKDLGNYCPSATVSLRSKVYRALRKRRRAASFLRGCLKASSLFNAKELGESQYRARV